MFILLLFPFANKGLQDQRVTCLVHKHTACVQNSQTPRPDPMLFPPHHATLWIPIHGVLFSVDFFLNTGAIPGCRIISEFYDSYLNHRTV